MDKPQDIPQEKWDGLSLVAKAQYITLIEKMGSYEAVKQWMTDRANKSHKSRLSDKQVNEIRESSLSNAQIATKYNISASYASKIRNGHRL